jgi:hypothetical protein
MAFEIQQQIAENLAALPSNKETDERKFIKNIISRTSGTLNPQPLNHLSIAKVVGMYAFASTSAMGFCTSPYSPWGMSRSLLNCVGPTLPE